MIGRLLNLGTKVNDVQRELDFLRNVGAEILAHETLSGPDGSVEYGIVRFGETRVFLSRPLAYEGRLGHSLPPGLAHAVFEVDDLDEQFERIRSIPAEVLLAPIEVSGAFGTRRVAIFRSPNGFIFEIAEILKLIHLE